MYARLTALTGGKKKKRKTIDPSDPIFTPLNAATAFLNSKKKPKKKASKNTPSQKKQSKSFSKPSTPVTSSKKVLSKYVCVFCEATCSCKPVWLSSNNIYFQLGWNVVNGG